jgi:hypothetical protein
MLSRRHATEETELRGSILSAPTVCIFEEAALLLSAQDKHDGYRVFNLGNLSGTASEPVPPSALENISNSQ